MSQRSQSYLGMATPITFYFLVDVAAQQLLPPWGWSPSDRYSRPKGEAICHHHTHSSSWLCINPLSPYLSQPSPHPHISHFTALLHPHISHLTATLHPHTSQSYSTLISHTSQSYSTLIPHSLPPPSSLTVFLHPHTSQSHSNLTHNPSPTWSCTRPKMSFCCPVSVFRLCFHVP